MFCFAMQKFKIVAHRAASERELWMESRGASGNHIEGAQDGSTV